MEERLVWSQIGYDCGQAKQVLLANAGQKYTFVLQNVITKEDVFCGKLTDCGEKWGEVWQKADFSGLEKPGDFAFQLVDAQGNRKEDAPILHIGKNLLWNRTWYACSLAQLDVRAANCYPQYGGWRDCGSELQEVSSHVIMLDAMCELYTHRRLPLAEKEHVREHIVRGANYICRCQQENGGFVHEVKHNPSVSFANCCNATGILARVETLLREECPQQAAVWSAAARRGYAFVKSHDFLGELTEQEYFSITHDAPEELHIPPAHRTRDLLSYLDMLLYLWQDGENDCETEEEIFSCIREILSRQIPKTAAQYGLYGHFYTYPGYTFSEKANYHSGAWDLPYKDYNQGTHKPYWVLPLLKAAKLFPNHPDVTQWTEAVRQFAFHFFLPGCLENPFGILPAGVYQKEGILYFSGWYHGHAKIYGYAAAMAMVFYREWQDDRFLQIAQANMQWIAGLNVGNISLMVGVGDAYVKDWNALYGTVINGFDASKQFSLAPVSAKTDLPLYLDDEGAIHHCAGFLYGLCACNP